MPVAPCTHCGHPVELHSTADGVCFICSLAEGPCAVVVGIISDDESLNRRIEVKAEESFGVAAGAPGSTETGVICYLLMAPGTSTIDQVTGHLQSLLGVPLDQALSLFNPVADVQVPCHTAIGPWDNQVLMLRPTATGNQAVED